MHWRGFTTPGRITSVQMTTMTFQDFFLLSLHEWHFNTWCVSGLSLLRDTVRTISQINLHILLHLSWEKQSCKVDLIVLNTRYNYQLDAKAGWFKTFTSDNEILKSSFNSFGIQSEVPTCSCKDGIRLKTCSAELEEKYSTGIWKRHSAKNVVGSSLGC